MTRRVAMVLLAVAVPLLALVVLVRVVADRRPTTRPTVVATIYPLAEFARRVGGDRMDVLALVPAGAEAHEYEPGPQDVARISRARLFIYNGAGFEPWVDRVLPTLPPSVGVVRATAGLRLISLTDDDAERPGTPPPASWDPHVWLDPSLAARIIESLEVVLIAADPAGRDIYRHRAAMTRSLLASLDTEFADGLSRCERRALVTAHTAFAYLARRYHLEHVGLSGFAPEAEPAPGMLAKWAAVLRAQGVRTVFVDRRVSPRVAETLAREIGARVAVLDPIESLAPADLAAGDDYFVVMRRNLKTLRVELSCP
ncbi:MAG: zinc ABC transporter substrate-binding protein [Armatimonadetes bacterium]|nr:zinc ABC transporter substrate-binding protein [Armatimonadota bacterium]